MAEVTKSDLTVAQLGIKSLAAIMQKKNVVERGTPQLVTLYNFLSSARGLDKGISDMEARLVYRIMALPRRIADLKEEFGCQIDKLRKIDPTGKPYVRYYLVLPKDGDMGEEAHG
ncbi:hypothetical protein EVC11_037 [Rhizobium phage RHph_I20]|uniref:Uncharacterized protein n=1 Tax=Rhizobium phage RHph_I20 TaxID=2509730 RepID=A0A7S5UZ55_9CAUD|nr:hypothetical protein EVC11_037 [Rhizobium phage RHph_I20]